MQSSSEVEPLRLNFEQWHQTNPIPLSRDAHPSYQYQMFAKSVVLLIAACAVANAFGPSARFASRAALKMSETPETETAPEQTVQDLNLEEMFEVFEAADEATPDEKPKSVPSKMSASGIFGTDGAKKTVGASSPLGFFDPAGFSVDVEEAQYKLYQEAETKHCRVAMLAFLGIVMGELINPGTPAIYQSAEDRRPLLWALRPALGLRDTSSRMAAYGETMKEPLGVAKLKPIRSLVTTSSISSKKAQEEEAQHHQDPELTTAVSPACRSWYCRPGWSLAIFKRMVTYFRYALLPCAPRRY